MEKMYNRRISKKITISIILSLSLIFTAITPTTVNAAKKVTKPSQVKKLKATASNETSIKLSWSKVKKANGYQVLMATSSKGKYKVVKTIKKGKTVKFTKGKLKSNTKYWFKVRAYKLNGKKKVYGKYSTKKSCKTKNVSNNSNNNQSNSGYTGEIQIVHVNDMHNHLNAQTGEMGYANSASFYEYAKGNNVNTLFLDAGDCFFGDAYGTVDQGEWMPLITNTMGIDAMVTGNHEYTYGTEQLLKLTKLLDYPALCANIVYKDSGKQPFDSYYIKTLPNGMKVGIIGLTTQVAAAMGAADIKYEDAVRRANEVAAELKPQVDLTIALCHIGERELTTTNDIANEVKDIDLIIDGHSHTALPEGRTDNKNKTLIAQTGEYTNNIGLVTASIKNNKMVSAKAKLYSANEVAAMNLEPKKKTQNIIDKFVKFCESYFSEVVGKTDVVLNGFKNDIRTKETNLGNLFADVMRKKAGADVGMFKAGPISTSVISEGEITRQTLQKMTRVDSLIITKKLTGEDILEFLNYSLGSFPEENGSFQQVSGITFSIDEASQRGIGDKVFNVKIGGKPMVLTDTYTVATILGSDEEPGMVNGTYLKSHGFSSTIMYDYIQDLNNKTITNNEAFIDGRITIESRP